ncbi:MAG: hypothetical protein HY726_19640, partial [Candidatus Rokubacteria bacterium]|nr:hypothetical protein [Candidatus Rokubacteria bacterium]
MIAAFEDGTRGGVGAVAPRQRDLRMWLHSDHYTELMRRRVARLEPEMVCAAQLREELAPVVSPGMSLLDAGCGPGHY